MCTLELLFTMLHTGSFVLEHEGKIMWSYFIPLARLVILSMNEQELPQKATPVQIWYTVTTVLAL